MWKMTILTRKNGKMSGIVYLTMLTFSFTSNTSFYVLVFNDLLMCLQDAPMKARDATGNFVAYLYQK